MCLSVKLEDRHLNVLIRQSLENTAQKGPNAYFTVAKKDSISCAVVLNLWKWALLFRGNVNNLNSQMFVKEDLHQLLAPVKTNRWASELERIAVFWCERSQNMPGVGFEPTPPHRRPEHPNSSTIDIAQSTDDLKSGAFDHSAILAPIKVLCFRK